jgi:hypothetical protein
MSLTAQLIAAGVSCSGPPFHVVRHWSVDVARRLHLRLPGEAGLSVELQHALMVAPIPGAARPLALDAIRLVTLLENGSAWRLDIVGQPRWRPLTTEVISMQQKNNSPALVAGGAACGGLWVVDRERRVWSWAASGKTPVGEGPVPGDALVLAVDLKNRTAVLADGRRFAWLAGRWVAMPSFGAADGKVTVVFRRGSTLADGDVRPGETRVFPEHEARALFASGVGEPAPAESA